MRTLVVAGSGPSLNAKDIRAAEMAGIRTIAVGDAWAHAPKAIAIYHADKRWWDAHIRMIRRKSPASLWTQDATAAEIHGLIHIRSKPLVGLSANESLIHQGLNSGYQAVNLALHFGAKLVLLTGFDMSGDHGIASRKRNKIPNCTDYGIYRANFDSMAPERAGLAVWNVSRESALKCFPRMTMGEALARLVSIA